MAIRDKINQIIESNIQSSQKLQDLCTLLKKSIIPFGKGICGQVALSNENFVVQDVSEQDNYISCGIDVKSEIVVPIIQEGKNIGQIDIDSHDIAPFTKEDEDLLEFICTIVASLDLGSVINQDPS